MRDVAADDVGREAGPAPSPHALVGMLSAMLEIRHFEDRVPPGW